MFFIRKSPSKLDAQAIYGYARVSTRDQDLAAQDARLREGLQGEGLWREDRQARIGQAHP
jgi:hypothetical protein